MAAVADRFDVLPTNARYIAVYPAYVVIRGPYNALSVPAIRGQPWWPGTLFACRSAIECCLRRLPHVPSWKSVMAWELEGLGPLKQKVPELERWRKGVH